MMTDDDSRLYSDGSNGQGNDQGNGNLTRSLLDDPELAQQFDVLFAAAHDKGFETEEVGFGMISAAAEYLLANGVQECCVMQLLVDFLSTYYGYWHDRMGEGAEGEPPAPQNN